jgi:hypothetical protein
MRFRKQECYEYQSREAIPPDAANAASAISFVETDSKVRESSTQLSHYQYFMKQTAGLKLRRRVSILMMGLRRSMGGVEAPGPDLNFLATGASEYPTAI